MNQTDWERYYGRPYRSLPDGVSIHDADVLDMEQSLGAEVCFRVGLIEHFDEEGTARCIDAHFEQLDHGGIALITYPTPTWLYRVVRYVAELLGLWKFHDERTLSAGEVNCSIDRHWESRYDRIQLGGGADPTRGGGA